MPKLFIERGVSLFSWVDLNSVSSRFVSWVVGIHEPLHVTLFLGIFAAIMHGIDFMIYFSANSLLWYIKYTGFWMLIFVSYYFTEFVDQL
jgi:hypothetical protein